MLEYIARYAYRVAITNSRILDVTGSNVSYDYKDYRKGGKHGVMTMEIDKFIGLLSMHVLPDRFVRIRHYGILSPCNREALRNIQQQLDVPPVPKVRMKKSYLEICLLSFVAYFEIVTSLFVYIVKRYNSVFSSASCHSPFGNHTKTDIFRPSRYSPWMT